MTFSALEYTHQDLLLPAEFYLQPTADVAKALLGKLFMRRLDAAVLLARIVETEAYHETDKASHSHIGKTRRNDVMFRAGGHLYVYFTYGMHYCMNVVTEAEGIGAAVLIRALEPVEGLDEMRRGRGPHRGLHELTNGPAKCCRAFHVDRRQNGLFLDGSIVGILDAPATEESDIVLTTRIGIRYAREELLRFLLRDNPWTSSRRVKTSADAVAK